MEQEQSGKSSILNGQLSWVFFFFAKAPKETKKEKERFFNNGTGTVEYLNGKKYVS